MKNKILLLTIIIIVVLGCSSSKNIEMAETNFSQEKTYEFVTYVYPPYSYINKDGEVDGISIAILKEIDKNIDEKIKFNLLPSWTKALKSAEIGISDGIVNIYETKERKEIFNYPDMSLTIDEVGVFGSILSPKINKIEDLKGKKVAVIKGYKYTPEFDNYAECKKIETANENELFELLARGKVDYAINSIATGEYFLKYGSISKKRQFRDAIENIDVQPIILKVQPLHVAIPKSIENSENLTKKISNTLIKLQSSGKLFQIKNQYK